MPTEDSFDALPLLFRAQPGRLPLPPNRQPDMIGPIYRVTAAGRQAWESKDLAVPSDYRFILWLIDFHGPEHLDTLMRQFPEQMLSECLAEMEELRLIEQVPFAQDAGAAQTANGLGKTEAGLSAGQGDILAARDSLSRHGAYLAEDRLKDRPAVAKLPSEITILIVEDDPDHLALAELRVSMAGYAVRVANSQAALVRNLVEKGVPDLLLLDVMLPDGNGFEILTKLRRHRLYASLPIVLLTAKSDPADISKGLSLGADGYITKPYSKNILAEVVRKVLPQIG